MPMLRGALIEYGTDLIGPIPNVVIFQFNPEKLTRTLQIPPRPTGATQREVAQAGEKTFEQISFTAHFSAANMLDDDKLLARMFGVGPQLCALEKMAQPTAELAGLLAAVDAVGDALGGEPHECQNIPREQFPRILFIWGPARVLPVTIDAMTINELEYDRFLNPLRAEVALQLMVTIADKRSDDDLAKGALEFTTLAKEAQAIANLANVVTISDAVNVLNTTQQVVDLILI